MDCLDENMCDLKFSKCLSRLDEVIKHASGSHVIKVSQANSNNNQTVCGGSLPTLACNAHEMQMSP